MVQKNKNAVILSNNIFDEKINKIKFEKTYFTSQHNKKMKKSKKDLNYVINICYISNIIYFYSK